MYLSEAITLFSLGISIPEILAKLNLAFAYVLGSFY